MARSKGVRMSGRASGEFRGCPECGKSLARSRTFKEDGSTLFVHTDGSECFHQGPTGVMHLALVEAGLLP